MEVDSAILQSIVMYFLAIVVAVVAAFMIRGIVLAIRQPEAPKPAAAPARAPAAAPAEDPARDDVAVISAAVYAMLGAHRIVRIQPSISGTSWAAQGRIIHHTSHRPGRR